MADLTLADIEAGERLLAKATQGVWKWDTQLGLYVEIDGEQVYLGDIPFGYEADLIPWLHNHAAVLLAAARSDVERRTRLSTHGVGCYGWGPRHYDCAMKRIDDLEAVAKAAQLTWTVLEMAGMLDRGGKLALKAVNNLLPPAVASAEEG